MSIKITKEIWKEFLDVLGKHHIPYTTHLESRDIPRSMEQEDVTVYDEHIMINLIIPDYYGFAEEE